MSATPGTLALVVGPSGAGKDSLLRFARGHFAGRADVVFPRRVITRPRGDASEDHVSVDEDAFARLEAEGGFALHWRAHDLSYGVPWEIASYLASGRLVVVNVSRTVVAGAARAFPRTALIEITAPPHVLAARLASRGREAPVEAARRVARAVTMEMPAIAHLRIDNSAALEDAGREFVSCLERYRIS